MRKIAIALFFLVLSAVYVDAQTKNNVVLAREYVGYSKDGLQEILNTLPLRGDGPRFSREPVATGFRYDYNKLLVWIPDALAENVEVILFCVMDDTEPKVPAQSYQEHLGIVQRANKHTVLKFDNVNLRFGIYWLFVRNTNSGTISLVPINIRILASK